MGENVKFEKVRAYDGIHTDGIDGNATGKSANVWALAIIALSVALFAAGVSILFKGAIL